MNLDDQRHPSSCRPDGLCRNGLHAWVPANIYVQKTGNRCRPCRTATMQAGRDRKRGVVRAETNVEHLASIFDPEDYSWPLADVVVGP